MTRRDFGLYLKVQDEQAAIHKVDYVVSHYLWHNNYQTRVRHADACCIHHSATTGLPLFIADVLSKA